MKISRHGIVERPNNLPHISGAVVHGDTVYLQGVTPDPRIRPLAAEGSRCDVC